MLATREVLDTASWKCGSIMGRGYRIYYVHRGAQIVILLCGGDKRTQQQDIKRAQKLAATL
jgi:putative addiction module killer protein